MFQAILTYIGDGIAGVIDLFAKAMGSGIGLFWDETLNTGAGGLTQLGEILLLSAIVGLALFGIKFIRSMIPFVK